MGSKRLQFTDEFFKINHLIYSGLKTKKEKGAFRDGLIKRTPGLTRQMWYDGLKKIANEEKTNCRSDKNQPRVADKATLEKDMRVISAIKLAYATNDAGRFYKKGKVGKTDEAIQYAYTNGLISQKYSKSTVDRYLRNMRLNSKGLLADRAAIHLEADFTNQWWQLDSSPAISIYVDTKSKTKRLVYDNSIKADTSHGRDRLIKLGLKRIIGYHVVDVYSKSFDAIFFADHHLGENSDDLITALFYFINEKTNKNNKFCGLPLNFYTDPGPAFKAKQTKYFASYFGINHVKHEAGKSNATGAVESRIGHNQDFERKFGFLMKRFADSEDRFETFKEFMENEIVTYNEERGYYEKFMEGFEGRSALIIPAREDFIYSRSEPVPALVDRYGDIVIDNVHYFTHPDLVGQTVMVQRRYASTPIAITKEGEEITCSQKRSVSMGDYWSNPKTDWERSREEVKVLSKKIRNEVKPIQLDNPPEVEAFFEIVTTMGIYMSDIPDDVQEAVLEYFKACLTKNGQITETDKATIQNILNKYRGNNNE